MGLDPVGPNPENHSIEYLASQPWRQPRSSLQWYQGRAFWQLVHTRKNDSMLAWRIHAIKGGDRTEDGKDRTDGQVPAIQGPTAGRAHLGLNRRSRRPRRDVRHHTGIVMGIQITRAERGDALEFCRLEAECFEMDANA